MRVRPLSSLVLRLRPNYYAVLGIVVFAFSVAAFSYYPPSLPDVSVTWEGRASDGYAPATRVSGGKEIVLVFIGSPTCAWSNIPSLPGVIEEAKLRLSAEARKQGYGFSAVGLAKSTQVAAGERFLRRFGAFDEVATGRGWFNTAITKYVHADFAGSPSTPQLVILTRNVLMDGNYTLADEIEVLRKVGANPIEQWVRSGMPLPKQTFVAAPL